MSCDEVPETRIAVVVDPSAKKAFKSEKKLESGRRRRRRSLRRHSRYRDACSNETVALENRDRDERRFFASFQ